MPMPTLPSNYLSLIQVFVPLFSNVVWQHAQVLLVGAILAPGQRTVTAALRIMGLSAEKHFQTYHRVLNRASWSSWQVSRRLLALVVKTFAAVGPIVFGFDDTIERRRGLKIKARGLYRDPVRSSRSQLVKVSGLRWLSLMVLVPIPWAQRVWALPFLTVLAPSERYYQGQKRAHKKLTDWGRQALLPVRRWLPERKLVVAADSSFAVIGLLWRLSQLTNPICMIARLRLDAGLYAPAPARRPGQRGRTRLKGERLPTLAQDEPPAQLRAWCCRPAPYVGKRPPNPPSVRLLSRSNAWPRQNVVQSSLEVFDETAIATERTRSPKTACRAAASCSQSRTQRPTPPG
jgi:hypothetical protein